MTKSVNEDEKLQEYKELLENFSKFNSQDLYFIRDGLKKEKLALTQQIDIIDMITSKRIETLTEKCN